VTVVSSARCFDALVVGGGYIGCSVASALATSGLSTALLDRGPIPGGASRANYGNIQVQDAELDHSLPMVNAARRRFAGLEEELGQSVGYRRVGSLLLIETEAQWALMATRVERLRAVGIQAEMVPARRLAELEPLLDERALLGACYHADEGQVSPFAFMAAFLQRGRRHGLVLFPDTEVLSLDVQSGHVRGVRTSSDTFSAGAVILATGAWTPALGRALGRAWGSRHVHGQALVTESSSEMLNNHLSSAAFFDSMHDGDPNAGAEAVFAVAQTADGHFLLGEAGVITERLEAHSTLSGQAAIAREALRFLPVISQLRILRGWAAPVAFTDDGLPLLGPVGELDRLFMATAFKSTVVVTPWVGDVVTEWASTGRTSFDLAAFAPDRVIGHG
jgi:glycine/D-amino acid oxidase-like deaminating enzyme